MIALLLLLTGCNGKDDATPTDGGAGDGGGGACTLELASGGDVEAAYCEALVDILAGMEPVWQWTGDSTYPDYNHIWVTPAVGDVTGDGVPDVVFTTVYYYYYSAAGLLIVLDGATGEQHQMFDAAGEDDYISASGGVALGDLDGDGTVEIVTISQGNSLVAFHADGTTHWISEANEDYDFYLWTAPALGDMDGDGRMEILAGRALYDADGNKLAVGGEEAYGDISYSGVFADLDDNGKLEAVVGCQSFDIDGNALWSTCDQTGDGMAAVADFDGDGKGEVVLVSWTSGTVHRISNTGRVVWSTTVWEPAATGYPGGGGPPAVADFNGDGKLEIAVRGQGTLELLDEDGRSVWSFPITDEFGFLGGVSGFDFDDDGILEVLVADEDALYAVDGKSGKAVMTVEEHAGYTILAYPVVADVDDDGRANVLLPSNNGSGEWTGLTALDDLYGSWSPAGRVWHQHATFPGAIGEDLRAQGSPQPWDEGEDRYRVQANGERGEVWVASADLKPLVSDQCLRCNSAYVDFELAVQVANTGAVDQEKAFAIGVYGVTDTGRRELIDTAKFDLTLRAGRSTDAVKVFGRYATSVGFTSLEVQVDGAEVRDTENLGDPIYLDCDRGNNVISIPLDDC